ALRRGSPPGRGIVWRARPPIPLLSDRMTRPKQTTPADEGVAQETEKGFGSGLRAQLDRARDRSRPARPRRTGEAAATEAVISAAAEAGNGGIDGALLHELARRS